MSQNNKAKSILCCSLSKKEFNRIFACKSAKEKWDKMRLTYEGTDKVPHWLYTPSKIFRKALFLFFSHASSFI
ncbi:hypothetical protein Taro_035142 [Colocasia esculenta]|uniref:Uncharacterized protein n=1 Tax=Colocasia esculenta TaxID=4460 RepID=A0A843W2X1_COLES|nr:hypothetical protein [Colocasia esculenta]